MSALHVSRKEGERRGKNGIGPRMKLFEAHKKWGGFGKGRGRKLWSLLYSTVGKGHKIKAK